MSGSVSDFGAANALICTQDLTPLTNVNSTVRGTRKPTDRRLRLRIVVGTIAFFLVAMIVSDGNLGLSVVFTVVWVLAITLWFRLVSTWRKPPTGGRRSMATSRTLPEKESASPLHSEPLPAAALWDHPTTAPMPIPNIGAMRGVEFEEYVASVFRSSGYQVETTKVVGDFGVDLVARIGGKTIAVQCKGQADPVTGAAVQQVVAGAVVYGCASTMVVSNRSFTKAAIQLAEQNGCELIDKSKLQAMAELGQRAAGNDNRAVVAAKKGNWDRARRLAASAADGGESFAKLAVFCVEEGLSADKERFLQEAIARGNNRAYLQLADRYRTLGHDAEAERLLELAEEFGEAHGMRSAWAQSLLRQKALLRAHQERWEEAEQLVRCLSETDRDDLLWDMAFTLACLGRWDEAERLV